MDQGRNGYDHEDRWRRWVYGPSYPPPLDWGELLDDLGCPACCVPCALALAALLVVLALLLFRLLWR
ncbi:MAG TPA: hypothetical protein VJR90_11320 [Gammaproteobacteria bacterium]|nr:hypothetical protein [Gammaproteobacteria bacterium]